MSPSPPSSKSRSRRREASLPGFSAPPNQAWFSRTGCVVTRGTRVEVHLGDVLVGAWEQGETATRNMLLVQFSQHPQICLETLAEAFGVTSETLRLIRRQYESEGLAAVMARRVGGSKPKVDAALRRKLEALFAAGKTIDEVHQRFSKRVSRATVGAARKRWADGQSASARPEPRQVELVPTPGKPAPAAGSSQGPSTPDEKPAAADAPQSEQATEAVPPPVRAPTEVSERAARADVPSVGSPEEDDTEAEVQDSTPVSQRGVEHLGGWILLALVGAMGFYRVARSHAKAGQKARTLRVAMDAVMLALAAGERCVEGVRRLATSSAAALLLARSAPSANWVRRTLGAFARGKTSEVLQSQIAGYLLREALASTPAGEALVLYVDGHLSPYTGMHTLRRGWRMQDKATVPGTTYYYVHDAEGRPVFRIPVPSHGSLTSALVPLSVMVRMAVGTEVRILFVFDRGGAFPETMAEMRDGKVDFLTYERAPYRPPGRAEFQRKSATVMVRKKGRRKERVRILDRRTNLGKGRGRVRRLCLEVDGDRRLNLLTSSDADAAWLVKAMARRWWQENAFKHGVERWGINQLDGRSIRHYDPDTVIPNPERRRLEWELEDEEEKEQQARRTLRRLKRGDPEREAHRVTIREAVRRQRALRVARAETPKEVPLKDTGLNNELVYHPDDYKGVIDLMRIVLANAESNLAKDLAPQLRRPREAKRVLQNLLKASGDIHVNRRSITVTLRPAGTRNELQAVVALLDELNRRKLVHPGDSQGRRLRFRVQIG